MDRVKPLKMETNEDGTQTNPYPEECNPNQDYIAAKGISFQNLINRIIDLSETGAIRFADADHVEPKTILQLRTAVENIFDNTNNGFVATNVQAAIEEARNSSAENFSYQYVRKYVNVPIDQQMFVYQELIIIDELDIEGEVIITL